LRGGGKYAIALTSITVNVPKTIMPKSRTMENFIIRGISTSYLSSNIGDGPTGTQLPFWG
jgi:hypothetical protein